MARTTLKLKFIRGVTFDKPFKHTGPKPDQDPISYVGKVLAFGIRDQKSPNVHWEIRTDQAANANETVMTWDDQIQGQWRVKVADEDTALIKFDIGTWWVDDVTGTNRKRVTGGELLVTYK